MMFTWPAWHKLHQTKERLQAYEDSEDLYQITCNLIWSGLYWIARYSRIHMFNQKIAMSWLIRPLVIDVHHKSIYSWCGTYMNQTFQTKRSNLVLLNTLRSHILFNFSANKIAWSRLLIYIHILNGKQWRSRSVGFLEANWSGSTPFAKAGYMYVFNLLVIFAILAVAA